MPICCCCNTSCYYGCNSCCYGSYCYYSYRPVYSCYSSCLSYTCPTVCNVSYQCPVRPVCSTLSGPVMCATHPGGVYDFATGKCQKGSCQSNERNDEDENQPHPDDMQDVKSENSTAFRSPSNSSVKNQSSSDMDVASEEKLNSNSYTQNLTETGTDFNSGNESEVTSQSKFGKFLKIKDKLKSKKTDKEADSEHTKTEKTEKTENTEKIEKNQVKLLKKLKSGKSKEEKGKSKSSKLPKISKSKSESAPIEADKSKSEIIKLTKGPKSKTEVSHKESQTNKLKIIQNIKNISSKSDSMALSSNKCRPITPELSEKSKHDSDSLHNMSESLHNISENLQNMSENLQNLSENLHTETSKSEAKLLDNLKSIALKSESLHNDIISLQHENEKSDLTLQSERCTPIITPQFNDPNSIVNKCLPKLPENKNLEGGDNLRKSSIGFSKKREYDSSKPYALNQDDAYSKSNSEVYDGYSSLMESTISISPSEEGENFELRGQKIQTISRQRLTCARALK